MKYLLITILLICAAFVAAYFITVKILNDARKCKVKRELNLLKFFIQHSLKDHISKKHILNTINEYKCDSAYRGAKLTELTNLYIDKFELVDEFSAQQLDLSECEKRIKLQNEFDKL
jgi:hypothetical protein